MLHGMNPRITADSAAFSCQATGWPADGCCSKACTHCGREMQSETTSCERAHMAMGIMRRRMCTKRKPSCSTASVRKLVGTNKLARLSTC